MNRARLPSALLVAGLSALVPQSAIGAPARADRDTDGDGLRDAAEGAGQVVEVDGEEQFEDGEETDEEVARYSAASTDKVEGNLVLSGDGLEKLEDAAHAEMGHEDDPDHATLSDACPPGAFKAGAWVHEVTVDSSEEAGTEFEELVIVR